LQVAAVQNQVVLRAAITASPAKIPAPRTFTLALQMVDTHFKHKLSCAQLVMALVMVAQYQSKTLLHCVCACVVERVSGPMLMVMM
jgi:hypothetical protein